MKRMALLAFAALLSGCATAFPAGSLFTDLQLPVDATANSAGDKVGSSMCTSILALVATGDCSIEAAARSGGISKIHHVDWQAHNILGIYGRYETKVYGQ